MDERFTAAGYSLMAMRDGQPDHTCTVVHFERPLTGPEIRARAEELCKIAFMAEYGWSGHHVRTAPFNGIETSAHALSAGTFSQH